MKQECKNCLFYIEGDKHSAPYCTSKCFAFRFGSAICESYKDSRIFTVGGKYTETFIDWLLCAEIYANHVYSPTQLASGLQSGSIQ
jgi:hypothetical protein